MRLTTAISMGVLVLGSAMALYAEPPPAQPMTPAGNAQPASPLATKPDVMGSTVEGIIQQLDVKATPSLLTVQRGDGSIAKVEADRASVKLVARSSEKPGAAGQSVEWSQLKTGQRVKIHCSMRGDRCIARHIELLD